MVKIAVVLFALVAVAVAAKDEVVPILSQESDINPDGSYFNKYESGDGSVRQEQGHLKNVGAENEAQVAEGSFSYTAPDGTPIQVTYVADENGFKAEGAHIPTTPAPQPIPEVILRSIEWIKAHPYVETKGEH